MKWNWPPICSCNFFFWGGGWSWQMRVQFKGCDRGRAAIKMINPRWFFARQLVFLKPSWISGNLRVVVDIKLRITLKSFANWFDLPSWELTYPTLGKGKSSSNVPGVGYVSSPEGRDSCQVDTYQEILDLDLTPLGRRGEKAQRSHGKVTLLRTLADGFRKKSQ